MTSNSNLPRRSSGLWLVLALVVAATPAPAVPPPAVPPLDFEGPGILVHPWQPVGYGQPLTIAATVTDPSGVAEVVAHYKGRHDDNYRSIRLERASGDEWSARIDPWETRGDRVSFFVEATDRNGRGPSRQGDPRRPFNIVVRTAGASVDEAVGPDPDTIARGALVGFTLVALFGLLLRLRLRKDRSYEQEFWKEALEPIAALPSRERLPALESFCSQLHAHPIRGHVRVGKREARRQFKTRWPEISLTPTAVAAAAAGDPRTGRDRFGNRRGSSVSGSPPRRNRSAARPRPGSRGTTLIELLIAIAVVATLLLIGVRSLRPSDRPVQAGADQLEALLAQSRSMAMARSRVFRVRPIDERSLTVEYGVTCSGVIWTTEPHMDLSFPRDVTLTDDSWNACFTSRGISANNFLITLQHPDYPSRNLELLAGGAVRRLD